MGIIGDIFRRMGFNDPVTGEGEAGAAGVQVLKQGNRTIYKCQLGTNDTTPIEPALYKPKDVKEYG